MGTSNDTREAETGHAGPDHGGKRVADQVHRRAVSKAHGSRPGRLIHLTGHLAPYGMLLAYIWHQHRTPKDAAA